MYTNKSKRLVLGQGEMLGHKHVLESRSNIMFERDDDSVRFMLSSIGIITHDEHDRMVYTPGKYRSYHQVEFNPMDGSVSRVFD